MTDTLSSTDWNKLNKTRNPNLSFIKQLLDKINIDKYIVGSTDTSYSRQELFTYKYEGKLCCIKSKSRPLPFYMDKNSFVENLDDLMGIIEVLTTRKTGRGPFSLYLFEYDSPVLYNYEDLLANIDYVMYKTKKYIIYSHLLGYINTTIFIGETDPTNSLYTRFNLINHPSVYKIEKSKCVEILKKSVKKYFNQTIYFYMGHTLEISHQSSPSQVKKFLDLSKDDQLLLDYSICIENGCTKLVEGVEYCKEHFISYKEKEREENDVKLDDIVEESLMDSFLKRERFNRKHLDSIFDNLNTILPDLLKDPVYTYQGLSILLVEEKGVSNRVVFNDINLVSKVSETMWTTNRYFYNLFLKDYIKEKSKELNTSRIFTMDNNIYYNISEEDISNSTKSIKVVFHNRSKITLLYLQIE